MIRNLYRAALGAGLLSAGLLAAAAAQGAGRDPAAGAPVSAADVVLYIDEAPCAGAAEIGEVVVQQEPMTMAQVLRALRLEAAHRGANGVHDIRVAAGTEGRFRVSGMAVRCPSADAPATPPAEGGPRPRGAPRGAAIAPEPADPKVAMFLAVLNGVERVETLHLGGRGAGAGRSVQDFAVIGSGRALDAAETAELRRLILDPGSYVFASSKRCPFIGDAAFVLHRGADSASIVLSTRCSLWSFAPSGAGARAAIEDFDPVAERLKALLAAAFGQNQK